MKHFTNTLKTLIAEHGIDILQQEQRLKAMLADLLPHDKQMRFLLELSLRAQIPQKLIAQQNKTRLGWEAQIKSLKHYFKDEYFLEDKAVQSVFDCWVEVLPRNRQKAVAPKLGNLYAKSKIKNIDSISWHNWHKFAFKQNSNWQPFFGKSKITNYQSFFKDIGIIKNSNNTGSYPKLLLPNSLLIEVSKQPPLELPIDSSDYSHFDFIPPSIQQKIDEEYAIMRTFEKENRKNELQAYFKNSTTRIYYEEKNRKKEAYEKYKNELQLVKNLNADSSKTFNIEQFINFGSLLGYDLSIPLAPNRPSTPSKEAVPKTYKKNSNSMSLLSLLIFPAIFFVILFYVLSDYYVARMILGIPLVLSVLFLIGSVISGQIFTEYFWIDNGDVDVKYNANEISVMEKKAKESYDKRLISYNEQLTIYNDKLIENNNKIAQQEKDLNETFPLIARQMWLQAMNTKLNSLNTGSSTDPGIAVKKLVARLALLYPQILKVGLKFPDFLQTAILLHLNNSVIVNIEVDEPYDRKTRKETNFIGSDDEGRDLICAENNMFVLRFSESQVTYALSECVSIVQELVMFTQSANTQHLLNIGDTSKNIEVLCWSKEEARLMAMNED